MSQLTTANFFTRNPIVHLLESDYFVDLSNLHAFDFLFKIFWQLNSLQLYQLSRTER